jgi:Tol biopolymer transport system component
VGASLAPHRIATYGNPDLFADGAVGWVWSRTGGKLLTASLSSLDDNAQSIERSALAVTDLATGETTDLATIDGYAGYAPAWSPDETRIALVSGDRVFSVDVRSGDRSLLARFPDVDPDSTAEIQWSPDGTHIAIERDAGDAGERLWVMNADGSDVRLLAEGYELILAAWSPDGSQLAFAEGSQSTDIRILVAPLDGSDPAEIESVPFVGCIYNYECGVTWSPDGSAIGFHKDNGEDSMIAANGSGEAEPIDDLTYRSWAGGCTDCGY